MFKKTVIFIGLSIAVIFLGVGIEIIVYEYFLGIATPEFGTSPHLGQYAIMVLIPVVYMNGVNNKKRIFIFFKSTLTLIAVYSSYYYLTRSILKAIQPPLFSNSFRALLLLMNLKGVIATLAGLYVSVQCMKYERVKVSFASYPTGRSGENREETPKTLQVAPCEKAENLEIASSSKEEAEGTPEVGEKEAEPKEFSPCISVHLGDHQKTIKKHRIGWFRGIVLIANLWCLFVCFTLSFPHGIGFLFLDNGYEVTPEGHLVGKALSYDEAKALGLPLPENRADYGSRHTGRALTRAERLKWGIDISFVGCFFFCFFYIVLMFSPLLKKDIYGLVVKRKTLEIQKDIEALAGRIEP